MKGKGKFPAKPLGDIFGIDDLKQLRQKRLLKAAPDNYTFVDDFFS